MTKDEPRPRSFTSIIAQVLPWRLVPAKSGESCRWECSDGRWVTVSLARDGELGSVVVASSTGERRVLDDYEAALALAKSWRTDVVST